MRFSIIVPVYNAEKYLRECIESVINQTYTDFELILVDDGSSDNSYEICRDYEKIDNRIIVIHKENSGSTAARKRGIIESRGDYIVTLDSDDYLAKNYLYDLNEVIVRYNPDIIKLNFVHFSENGRKEYFNKFQGVFFKDEECNKVKNSIIYDKDMPGINLGCCAFSIWSTVTKRNILLKYQSMVPEDIRMGEDLAIIAPMILNTESIYFMGGLYYYYRNTQNSIVNSFRYDEIRRSKKLIEFLLNNIDIKYHNQICVYTVFFLLNQLSMASKILTKCELCDYAYSNIDSFLSNLIDRVKITKMNIKECVKMFMLKFKHYNLFWLMMKIYHK